MSSTAKSILITASTGKIPLSTARSIIVRQSIAGTSAFLIKKMFKERIINEAVLKQKVKIILFLH